LGAPFYPASILMGFRVIVLLKPMLISKIGEKWKNL